MKNTNVTFADGKSLILHHEEEFTSAERRVLESMTSDQFKNAVTATGRFTTVPMGGEPWPNQNTQH